MERIVRVELDGRPLWGRVDGDEVVRLPAGPFGDRSSAGAAVGAIGECRLLAPVRPTKIICVGRNYVAHAAEHGAEVPAKPLLFSKPPSAVIGPQEKIVLPRESDRVEHEGELGLVIGRRVRRIAEDDAWGAVLGVTCADDVTARDLQRAEKQWTRGKGFDTFCPVGPWIVTGLGRGDVADLAIRCSVNGELRQRGRTSEMVFSPAFLVSYVSQVMTLEPGDLILTGTPAGVGPLAHGDEVVVEIENVGSLTNPVTRENDEL
ncbi:MAG: fumarylacetoacetate hydrolase family protein [Thermoanaerobaculales bacterium]|nr:fumarylacetoacetate hydrolase family protein [Thermoanaerobaculales bacterium]